MKKIILTLAGSLLISLAAVNAQTDTTRNREGSQTQRKSTRTPANTKQQGQQGQYGTQQDDSRSQWRTEDRESVMKDDVPEALVQTLNSDEYEGWENATIYRNKTTSEYMLIVSDGDQPKTFYFDKEGKAVYRPGATYQPGTSGTGTSGTTGTGTSGNTSGTRDNTSGTSGTSGQVGTTGTGTTGTSGNTSDTRKNTSGTTGKYGTQSSQDQTQWRTEDRIVVSQREIPSSLRTTLRDDKYKGWEKSTVYRNRTTNEYMVEINDGTTSKTYYFDKEGKAKDDKKRSS